VLAVACGGELFEVPIETPIRAKLDVSAFQRVLVAGFEPSTGVVATMIGGESRAQGGRPRRDARPPAERHSQSRQSRPQPAREQASPSRPPPSRPSSSTSDPIFSRPYEPGTAPAAAKVAEPVSPHAKPRERPVAALLGGLKRA